MEKKRSRVDFIKFAYTNEEKFNDVINTLPECVKIPEFCFYFLFIEKNSLHFFLLYIIHNRYYFKMIKLHLKVKTTNT